MGRIKLRKSAMPLGVFVVAICLPLVLTSPYYHHIMITLLIYILLAASLNLINGYGGQLNLGLGVFSGMGGYIAALMALYLGAPWWLTLPAAGIASALTGLIVSIPCRKLWGAYLAIGTICIHYALNFVWISCWQDVLGGEQGLSGIPGFSILNFEFVSKLSQYYLVLAIVAICLVIMYRIIVSPFGKQFVAFREDETLSEMIGINTARQKVLCFTISAFFMGVAGALTVHTFQSCAPVTFSIMATIAVLTMIIVGGQGTFTGPIIGAIVYITLMEVLRPTREFTLVIYGVLLILFLVFLPGGLVHLWGTIRYSVRGKLKFGKVSSLKE